MLFCALALRFDKIFKSILTILFFSIVLTDYEWFPRDGVSRFLLDIFTIEVLPACQFLAPQTRWLKSWYSVSCGIVRCDLVLMGICQYAPAFCLVMKVFQC